MKPPKLPTLINQLLALCVIGGIGITWITLRWGSMDNLQLIHAVDHGDSRAELRHRINVATNGTWSLLGVLIAINAITAIRLTRRD